MIPSERRRLFISLFVGIAITIAVIHPGYNISGDRPIALLLEKFSYPGIWLVLGLYPLVWVHWIAWVLFIGGNSLFYASIVWVAWVCLIRLRKRTKNTT